VTVEVHGLHGGRSKSTADGCLVRDRQVLPVTYGMGEESARRWGLFMSTSIKDGELPLFNEPGMFVLDTDDSLNWSSVVTMPFARPALDDVLGGLRFAQDNDYPARGAA
jgi:hypothetical protein